MKHLPWGSNMRNNPDTTKSLITQDVLRKITSTGPAIRGIQAKPSCAKRGNLIQVDRLANRVSEATPHKISCFHSLATLSEELPD